MSAQVFNPEGPRMSYSEARLEGAPLIAPSTTDHPLYDPVVEACRTVYDPEIPVNIYELGLIYAIEIGDEGAVKVEMTLTTPSCPSAQELPGQVEEMVRTVPGVTDVTVEIVWDPPWDPSRMTEDARLALNMY
jgi:FeS assembly SUF system protein